MKNGTNHESNRTKDCTEDDGDDDDAQPACPSNKGNLFFVNDVRHSAGTGYH